MHQQRQLDSEYYEVQNTIRAQFEEIEAMSENSENKDIVIQKLALQNQYLFGQYVKLYAKSLTVDDLSNFVDLSPPQGQNIKQFVSQQVSLAFNERSQLQLEAEELMERVDSISTSYLELKKYLEDLTEIYACIRGTKGLNLPSYENNSDQLLDEIMKEDLQILQNQSKDQRSVQQDSKKSSLSKKESCKEDKQESNGICAILRANQREIEEELKKRRESESSNNECGKLAEVIRGSVQRLKIIVDDFLKDNNNSQRKGDLLKFEIQNLEIKVEGKRPLTGEGEEEKWRKVIENMKKEQRDVLRKLKNEMEDKEMQLEERMNQMLQEEGNKVIDRSNEIQQIKEEIEEKMSEKDSIISELNDQLQRFQLQFKGEMEKKEQIKKQYQQRIDEIIEEMKQDSHQQNIEFQDEVRQIENKLHNMIKGREEYEIIVKREKDQMLIEQQAILRERDDIQRELIELQSTSSNQSKDIQNLQNEIRLLSDQLSISQRQIQLKELEAEEMQVTFNELENFSKKQLEVIQQQQAQIIRQEKNQQFRSLVKNSSEELQQLKEEFSEIVVKTRMQEKELLFSKSEITRLQQKIASLMIEIQDLQNNNSNKRDLIEEQQGNSNPFSNNDIRNYIQTSYCSKSSPKNNSPLKEVKETATNKWKNNYENIKNNNQDTKTNQFPFTSQLSEENLENEHLRKENKELIGKQNELIHNLEQVSDQNERSIQINVQVAQQRNQLQEEVEKLKEIIELQEQKISQIGEDMSQNAQTPDPFVAQNNNFKDAKYDQQYTPYSNQKSSINQYPFNYTSSNESKNYQEELTFHSQQQSPFYELEQTDPAQNKYETLDDRRRSEEGNRDSQLFNRVQSSGSNNINKTSASPSLMKDQFMMKYSEQENQYQQSFQKEENANQSSCEQSKQNRLMIPQQPSKLQQSNISHQSKQQTDTKQDRPSSSSSRQRISFEEDIKKLSSIAFAIGDKKQINSKY